jgi:hypothetical protein
MECWTSDPAGRCQPTKSRGLICCINRRLDLAEGAFYVGMPTRLNRSFIAPCDGRWAASLSHRRFVADRSAFCSFSVCPDAV